MKKLLSISTLLFVSGLAQAQTTSTISGVIKDLSNSVVTSSQVTFAPAPSVDSSIHGTGRFSPVTLACTINSDGTLSASTSGLCIVTNNTALKPSGTSYRICIQAYYATPGSCFL